MSSKIQRNSPCGGRNCPIHDFNNFIEGKGFVCAGGNKKSQSSEPNIFSSEPKPNLNYNVFSSEPKPNLNYNVFSSEPN